MVLSQKSICNDVFMYAQALDNSGETEYWRNYTRVAGSEPESAALRQVIDRVFGSGRKAYQGKHGSEYWLGDNGWSIIKAYPETLDLGGRVSPVLIVFNGKSVKRKNVSVSDVCRALSAGRRISECSLVELEKMVSFARLPLWVVRLFAFFLRVLGGAVK